MKNKSKKTQPETETKVAKAKTQPVEVKATDTKTKTSKAKTTKVSDTSDKKGTTRKGTKKDSAPVAEVKDEKQPSASVETENAANDTNEAQTDPNFQVPPKNQFGTTEFDKQMQDFEQVGKNDTVVEYDEDAAQTTDDVPVIEYDEPARATDDDNPVAEMNDQSAAESEDDAREQDEFDSVQYKDEPTADEVADQTFAAPTDDKDQIIKVIIEDEPVNVKKSDYIAAKTKDLISFGYATLTESKVAEQVEKILAGDTETLDIIGRMMQDDIVIGEQAATETVKESVELEKTSGALADWDDDIAAENDAHRAASEMVENEKLLESLEKNADNEIEQRELNGRELEKLAYYEKKIEDGLKSYVSIGKYLYAVYAENLFAPFGSFAKYLSNRWGAKRRTSLYDIMRAYRTWRLATADAKMTFAEVISPDRWLKGADDTDETVHDAEVVDSPEDVCVCGDKFKEHAEDKKHRLSCEKCACAEYTRDANAKSSADSKTKKETKKTEPKAVEPPKSDSDAPSQRAIEELGKLTAKLEKDGLTDEDFEEFEKTALKWVYDGLREVVGGVPTQKNVAEAMDAFVEFARAKAFEIDGEQVAPVASFRITRGIFEQMQRERQGIREMLEARNKRLATPQERSNSEFSHVPPTDSNGEVKSGTPELTLRCSIHGEQEVHVFMFGAVQIKCGAVFGKPKGQDKVLFNPKLTKDNPIEGNELTH